MSTIAKRFGRGILVSAAIIGMVTTAAPRPAHAIAPAWAAAIGLGSFLFGAAITRPYWGYPAHGYPYPYYGYGYGYGGYPYASPGYGYGGYGYGGYAPPYGYGWR